MDDKVTMFGNIAHDMIGRVETVMANVCNHTKSVRDYLAAKALCDLTCLETLARDIDAEDLYYTLFSFIEIGMCGYLYVTGSSSANALANQMTDLYARKNADYGNSFDRSMDKFGIAVAAIRIGDKVNRLQSLVRKGEAEVKDESIADTFMDMACYAIMTIMWMRGTDGK